MPDVILCRPTGGRSHVMCYTVHAMQLGDERRTACGRFLPDLQDKIIEKDKIPAGTELKSCGLCARRLEGVPIDAISASKMRRRLR